MIARFIAAFVFFFSGIALAQVNCQLEWGYIDRVTGNAVWGETDAGSACIRRANSVAEWRRATYGDQSSPVQIDADSATRLCTYKIHYFSSGQWYTSGNTSEYLSNRCQQQCTYGGALDKPLWGCFVPSYVTSATTANCDLSQPHGNLTPGWAAVFNGCRYHADIIDDDLILAGTSPDGWSAYRYVIRWVNQGVMETPDNPDTIPPFPEVPPPPDPNGPDDPDDPDDPGDDDGDYTPLTCTDPPDFYDERYPQGMEGVWTGLKNGFIGSQLWTYLTHLVPNFQGTDCPVFQLPSMGGGIFGTQPFELAVPCFVWSGIKALFLLTASFFAFRLIFGGA